MHDTTTTESQRTQRLHRENQTRALPNGSVEAEEEGFDFFKWSDTSNGARLSKYDASWNHKCHHGAGIRKTVDCEFASDAVSSFSHSLETEVPFPAIRQDNRFYADAIVTDAQNKILRVSNSDLQFFR